MPRSNLKPGTRKLRSQLRKIKTEYAKSPVGALENDATRRKSLARSLKVHRHGYGNKGFRESVKAGVEGRVRKAFYGTFNGGSAAHRKYGRMVDKAQAYRTK